MPSEIATSHFYRVGAIPGATRISTAWEMTEPRYGGEFVAELFTYPGKGGWTFVLVPEEYAPRVTHGWGRTPVRATVDGYAWATSVWREKSGRTLLPVPRRARGAKGHADSVRVRLEFSTL